MRMRTAAPDVDACNQLVLTHLGLVRALASRLAQRVPSHSNPESKASQSVFAWLLHRNALGEVARPIHVAAPQDGGMVGKQL